MKTEKEKQEWLELYDSLSSDEVRLYKKLIRMRQALPLARRLDKRKTGKIKADDIVKAVREIRNIGRK